MTEAIIVFTGRSPKQILAEGGTQAWVLDPRRARMCTYVVCVQNRNTYEMFSPTEEHGTAFMVGKISEVDFSVEQPDSSEKKPKRYIIRFSEYAMINKEKAWDGSRNPVGYDDLASLGIDPDTLDFQPMPEVQGQFIPGEVPLTLAQAKKGLSLTFGVPPEAIEITIRG
jgi:hypothetical protein